MKSSRTSPPGPRSPGGTRPRRLQGRTVLASKPTAFESGYYRVHLVAADGDWITVYVPLNDQARYDPARPKPHLAKTKWDGEIDYGEFTLELGKGRFVWAGDLDYETDLLTVPLQLNTTVAVSARGDTWSFVVRDLKRI